MILVTCGTVSFPFKRLVDTIIEFYADNDKENIIIQSGEYQINSQYKHIQIEQYFSLEKMMKYYRQADIVISAGGEGSVFQILFYAKNKPIFFPRRTKFKEHVDDQQVHITQEICRKKLAFAAYNSKELEILLAHFILEKNSAKGMRFSSNKQLIKNLIKLTE